MSPGTLNFTVLLADAFFAGDPPKRRSACRGSTTRRTAPWPRRHHEVRRVRLERRRVAVGADSTSSSGRCSSGPLVGSLLGPGHRSDLSTRVVRQAPRTGSTPLQRKGARAICFVDGLWRPVPHCQLCGRELRRPRLGNGSQRRSVPAHSKAPPRARRRCAGRWLTRVARVRNARRRPRSARTCSPRRTATRNRTFRATFLPSARLGSRPVPSR